MAARDDFDLPDDVAYLNAASYSLLPKSTVAAGTAAMRNKAQPWLLPADFISRTNEGVRAQAARLINANPGDIALTPSVGYGVATAAKVIDVPRGHRVLVLQDDHASPVLEWQVRAPAGGFDVEAVAAPADHDWTSAVLAAIERVGARPLAVVSISSVHWADGAQLDMLLIAAAARKAGAALVVDATQGAGVTSIDVQALDPDFLIFPTYNWLLGPYGRAFLYAAPRRQNGVPLEQTAPGRVRMRAEDPVYVTDAAYLPDARRYDMGERDHFVSMPMTAASLDYLLAVTPPRIASHTRALTDRLADGLRGLPVALMPRTVRAPHILSLAFTRGMPIGLSDRLGRRGVYAAARLGRLRFSPHIYNTAADIDRAVAALREELA
jgi:selenocysteine lyase/cysteine desulfurase